MKNNDHNQKTRSLYLFELPQCFRPYASHLLSFLFLFGEGGGILGKDKIPYVAKASLKLKN